MDQVLVLNLIKSVRNKRIARKQSEYGTIEYHIENLHLNGSQLYRT